MSTSYPNAGRLSPDEAKQIMEASHAIASSSQNTIVVDLQCNSVVNMSLESSDKITVYYQHIYGYKIPIGMSGIALDGEFTTMCCPSHPYPTCATNYSSKEDFYPESENNGSGTVGSGSEGSGTFYGLDEDASSEDIKFL